MAVTDQDRKALVGGVESFLRDACPVDVAHKAFDGDGAVARSIWDGMMDLGLGGLGVSDEHGGLGLGLADIAAVAELIGWTAAPGPWIAHTLAGIAIDAAGSPEQRARWLPRLATGETVGTLALCEGPAWRPDQWTSQARDGRLTATKSYVMSGGDADIALVGIAGGRLGVVELRGPGISSAEFSVIDRTRPLSTLRFEAAPIELLDGDFSQRLLDFAAVIVAADAHGGARRMVEDIVEYSKARTQFGFPIAQFQAVKHKMADLALAIYHNGALYRRAAAQVDERSPDAALSVAVAKALITETFSNVARLATEAYGGIGYTWEHSAHIWLRRAMFDYAWLGSPDEHRSTASTLLRW
jgi:alkylation response protein AidB-like acyl-CoA dehydrogenase